MAETAAGRSTTWTVEFHLAQSYADVAWRLEHCLHLIQTGNYLQAAVTAELDRQVQLDNISESDESAIDSWRRSHPVALILLELSRDVSLTSLHIFLVFSHDPIS